MEFENKLSELLFMIEEEMGCYNERGDFLSCDECYNSCSFRQALPKEDDPNYQVCKAIKELRIKKKKINQKQTILNRHNLLFNT